MALAMSFFFAGCKQSANQQINGDCRIAGFIAATRDWLERRRFASSLCEKTLTSAALLKLALKVI
jgi:hypothetical protein